RREDDRPRRGHLGGLRDAHGRGRQRGRAAGAPARPDRRGDRRGAGVSGEARTHEGERDFRRFLERATGFLIPEDRWRFLAPRFLDRLEGRGFADVRKYISYL